MEKDNNVIAIVAIVTGLGFLAFLVYVLKLLREPAPATQRICCPHPNFPQIQIPEPLKTEETRPTLPHIINHNLIEANKIYEIKIPREELRAWSLRCRNKVDIQYSFEPSFSTYMTLNLGETISQDTAPDKSIYSIYVRSVTANVVVELELWR